MIEPIKMPHITAQNPSGQIVQMRSYLYQLVEQLTYTIQQLDQRLDEIEKNNTEAQ